MPSLLAMRFVRLFHLLAVPTTIFAIGLGRTAETRPVRQVSPVLAPLVVEPSRSDYARGRWGTVRPLDPTTGRPVMIAMDDGVLPQGLAWSPWRDGDGAQALATWRNPSCGDAFLIRFPVAGGIPLDRIPISDLPNWWGAPCWFPDGSPRALLAGVDGPLHRVDFAGSGESSAAPQLRPLSWPAGPDPTRPAHLGDLHWSAEPRMGGRLLAAACPSTARHDPAAGEGWSLWWLRLDANATSIVAAGRLMKPTPLGAEVVEERHPVVGVDTQGRVFVAYLERSSVAHGPSWRLRLAPIEFEDGTANPAVDPGATITLAEDASPTTPAFVSATGEIAYVPSYETASSARVERVAIPIVP
jgi:hypothetical protein